MSRPVRIKVGDEVNYWRWRKEGEPSGTGTVRMAAHQGGQEVFWIAGCSGCIGASHVALVAEPAPEFKPAPPRRQFECVTWDGQVGLDTCHGWEDSIIAARSWLRSIVRQGKHLDAWIVDHEAGLRHDLNGVITLEPGRGAARVR